ncbi:MAG: thioredoxin-disulfide reductase [Desulfobacterales bacterium]|nr:thioredoxin-disulfide reductase [Deltaproteobacteria bacterium]NNL42442.1 thioredoxin-disulfide reductase [Desulfobacterales bacterium]
MDTVAGKSEKEFFEQLRAVFEKMSHEIPLYMFVDPGQDDDFIQTGRQMVRAFRELTEKITFREFPLDHEMAKKWQVTASPTLLIAPETYAIRWLGAPVGEEGRTFLETLILVGRRQSNLNDQARKVIQNIDEKRKVKVFVSPSCPYCPQQAVNAVRAVIEKPELISLEIIDIMANPEMADQYGAQSVPQAFANEILIGMGAQTEEIFALSLQKLEPQTLFIPDSDAELVKTDLLIVGGGPAGLTAGIYAKRSGLDTVIVEGQALGGQVALTPVVENYPGFTQVGGKALVDIMVTHALEYTQIFQQEKVVDIQAGDPFIVTTSQRKFHARAVLLATGASHKQLGVPGESRLSGRGVSYCSTCDGPLFKNKKVIMVGGGNSAVTEALHLYHMGVDVTLVHRRDKLRAQDVLAKNLISNQIPILWNSEVKEIRGDQRVEEVALFNNRTNEISTLKTDGVFLAIGYSPSVELAQKVGVALTKDGYIKRDAKHRTNIPGIYSAGDVEGGYKQIVTAAGQGSEAAMNIFEDLINPYWQDKLAQNL